MYSDLLSTGVFMSVCEVCRSVITYQSQVIRPGDVPSFSKFYVCACEKEASLPLMSVKFVLASNVSKITEHETEEVSCNCKVLR